MNNGIYNCVNFIKRLYFSEKSSILYKKYNTLVFKVSRNINKLEIYNIINKFLNIKIKKIRTLLIKGKKKINKNNIGYRKTWKKVYIILKKGQNLKLNNLLK